MTEEDIKNAIEQLYKKLSPQVDLEKEFKDVYFKNAWNLYEN